MLKVMVYATFLLLHSYYNHKHNNCGVCVPPIKPKLLTKLLTNSIPTYALVITFKNHRL